MLPSVLLIDNHDSFTWNLAQLFEETGKCVLTVRPYENVNADFAASFDRLVFSPGPGIPSAIPIMQELTQLFKESKSILGVCLGFQAIVESFGGKLLNLPMPSHGHRQKIKLLPPQDSLFEGLDAQIWAGLYHSWAADQAYLPDCLRITAEDETGTIMAVSHKEFDIKGLQFHPESYMTETGSKIISNWLRG